ncbi:MAG: AAA family ATPase [Alphaproteobacteria bacterium]
MNEQTKLEVEKAHKNKLLSYSTINFHKGGLIAAVEYYKDKETPDLVILEEKEEDDNKMLSYLEKFAEFCSPNTKVIIVGKLNDINLYRKLISEGVTEYFTYPLSFDDLINRIETVFSRPDSMPKGKLISFYGARGGVGSSCLAHNVAWILSHEKKDDVILVDTDIFFGTAAFAFNLDVKQTIVDAIMQPNRLDQDLLEKIMIHYDDYLMILGSPANFSNNVKISIEVLDKIIDMLRQMADIVILDLPHNYEAWIYQTLIDSDEAVIVATPDLTSFRNIKNIKDIIDKTREKKPFKLVFNQYDSNRKTQLSEKDFSETLGVQPLMTMPYVPDVFGEANNNGQMICEMDPNNDTSLLLKELTSKISGWDIKIEKQQETKINTLLKWLKTPIKKM